MPEFLIDDDGTFTGSTALCVTLPGGGFMRVVEKCELLDEVWDAVTAAVANDTPKPLPAHEDRDPAAGAARADEEGR